jgi:NarL family two-component system response regulator LiaR
MRVLLVDDHVLFREGIASLLGTQADLKVVGGAGNVREAIEQARELEPELVLMDFVLPDGTGVEATEAILADSPNTKIVFLTVFDDDKRLFAAIRSGAKGYLPKSVAVDDLLIYLRRVERGDAAITPDLTARILDKFAQLEPNGTLPHSAVADLTERERQVLGELATGATNQEIARRLVISEQTVKNHVSHILAKLKLKSRYEAADVARRFGIPRDRSDR